MIQCGFDKGSLSIGDLTSLKTSLPGYPPLHRHRGVGLQAKEIVLVGGANGLAERLITLS